MGSLLALTVMGGQAQAGDAEAGKKSVEAKCLACHDFGAVFSKAGKVGPPLQGAVVGRAAGKDAAYKYSKPFLDKAATGLTWDEATLDTYLKKPGDFIKGTKMMAFPGIADDAERANVIAFLKTLK
ncbi:MAG: c-type cytochrome [Magnetococcales bacterium]|nr:c-type cytochrome [Magnetococcales bacterium]MBF0156732.1 c-type cytochrome [Magnetococcales bacterium]